MYLTGKKITVVGLARSGAGAARLLVDMGAVVTVTDQKTAHELRLL
jgi:UDP-N-acetylmuramoylalanine--D-glutamate ligase